MDNQVTVTGSTPNSVLVVKEEPVALEVSQPASPQVVVVAARGPQGPTGPAVSDIKLSDLTDVETSGKTEGSVLYFDSGAAKFLADDVNTLFTLSDGGNF